MPPVHLLGSLAALLWGQPRALTLSEAVAIAEAHGPDLVEARTAIPVAQAGIEVARQWPNPTASISVGSDDPVVFGGLDQRFPVFGQLATAIDAAEAEVRVAQGSLELKRIQLLAAVRRAYFALVAAEEAQRLAEDRLARSRKLVEITRRKLELGTASELETEQVDLEARRAEQARDDQLLAARAARLQLGLVVGLPEGEEIAAIDPLLPLPPAPAFAALLPRVDVHPEVVLAKRQAEAARLRATREGAAIRPVPDVGLEAQYLDCTNPWAIPHCATALPGTSYGLGLRLTLAFDLPVASQNRGAVHQAEREADQADTVAGLALRRRTTEARLALESLQGAIRRSAFLTQTVVPEALRVESLSRVAYQVGRVPLVVVLQAEADVNDVQGQAVAAAAAAQSAFADVEEAVGAAL